MTSSPIDEIKNRLDIVEVIGSYIKLQKTGANFRALCPFHSEKKPSFFISPSRQIWHCFGCSKGGDMFAFIREIEGVEFGDALRILAQKAGVELKRQSPELKTERQRLYEICEYATRFFEKQLEASKTGESAKKYLLERGIREESIKKWRLGYSPDAWRALSDFLVPKGYQREEMEKAGLCLKSETSDNFYDRFRGRIIFPIFDLNSQTVGFSGRVFKSEDPAKYINIPNTLLYDKSQILYGLNKAKVEIRKKDQCILVEGQTDAIMVHQAGFENIVATSGTALTIYQLKILKRYSDNLLIAFDMDAAGDTATKRGIDLAQTQGFNIKIVLLPQNSDPADIISKNLKNWEKLVKDSKSILDFYFETTFSRFDKKTPEGKKETSKILLPVLKRIPNRIEQSFWIQKLAKQLEVKEENVEEELKKVKLETFDFPLASEPEVPPVQKSRKELLEERLVTLILISKSPEILEFLKDEEIANLTPKIQKVLTKLKKSLMDERELDVMGLSPELTDLFNYCYLKAEIEEIEEKDIIPEMKNCLKELQSLRIRNKLDKISQEIKKAEEEKDLPKVQKLVQEFNHLSKEIT